MKSDEFIREVDEELQQDWLKQLWLQYGIFAIAGAILVVISTAGYVWWQNYQKSSLQQQGNLFLAAERSLGDNNTDGALTVLDEIIENYPGGPATLASLQQVNLIAASGKSDEALEILDGIAQNGSADPILRELAKLKSVQMRFDTADTAEIKKELEPLSASDQPFYHSARELLGLADLKLGNEEEAVTRFQELADGAQTPQGIKSRAEFLLVTLGIEPSATPDTSSPQVGEEEGTGQQASDREHE